MDITLEKVDQVRERTGVSYAEAKNALEISNGDVLNAIILLEEKSKYNNVNESNKSETIDEFKIWLKDLINKGNVTRIKITKDGKKLVDVPVIGKITAGEPILAFENVTDLNVLTMGLTISTIGFVIFNLFYALFKFVAKLCGKELDQKGNFVFVDVVFILLIAFFAILVV